MNAPEEFDLDGVLYRARKMPCLDQDFVMRKLMTLAASAVPVIQAAVRSGGGAQAFGSIMKMDVADLMPLAQGIAGLPEEDANAIVARCLSHVQRGVVSPAGTSWANVWSTSAGTLMFEDITLFTMYQLVAHVVKKELGPFFGAALSGSSGPARPPT